MTRFQSIALALLAFILIVTPSSPTLAADSPVGTWLKKDKDGPPTIMLTIEKWGSGQGKLTYHFKGMNMVMTIVSALDGSDAQVLVDGKPSGETMAIQRIDKWHAFTVVKINGKPFGTSKGTFSDDFNTLTVENDFTAAGGGNQAGKSTEIWIRK